MDRLRVAADHLFANLKEYLNRLGPEQEARDCLEELESPEQ